MCMRLAYRLNKSTKFEKTYCLQWNILDIGVDKWGGELPIRIGTGRKIRPKSVSSGGGVRGSIRSNKTHQIQDFKTFFARRLLAEKCRKCPPFFGILARPPIVEYCRC